MDKSRFTKRYELFRRMLVNARKSAGLKQAEVAAILDEPQSFVSRYETGERRLDLVEFLEVAQAIELDVITVVKKLQKA